MNNLLRPCGRLLVWLPLFYALFFSRKMDSQTNRQIDSLLGIIKNAPHDTVAARVMAELSGLYFLSQPDTVIPFCNNIIRFVDARLGSADKKERRSYLLTKSAAVTNIAIVHYQGGNMDTAIAYQLKGLRLAEQTGSETEIATDRNNLASMYFKSGKTTEALTMYLQALQIQMRLGEKKGMAFTLNNIGHIYETQGQTRQALEYYFRGLKLQEEMKNKMGIGSSMNNIAALYMKQDEPEKALEYFNVSLKVRKEIGDIRGVGQCLNNMGGIYRVKKEYDKALEHFENAIPYFRQIDFKQGTASALNNIAGIYMMTGKSDKALTYLKESVLISETIGDKRGLSICFRNISAIQMTQKKLAEARQYGEQSLRLATEIGLAEMMRDAHFALFQADSAGRNHESALAHFRKYIVLRDSVINEESRKEGLKKQLQYDYEKKAEAAKLEQEKKDELARQERDKELIIRNSFIGGFLLVLLLAILILKGYRNKRRANQVILQQKAEVERAKEIIERQKVAVEEKQKEILDSIHYARRIQSSLMPGEKIVEKMMRKSRREIQS